MKTENAAELARRQGLNMFTAFVLVCFHVGAVAALFMFSWKALAVAVVLYYITVGLGISMGYHRLHTHRSYKVPLWLEYVFATCGAMTLEGGPIFWVATHRMHHQFSDLPGDPHSPRDGAFWSHMGWILWGDSNHNNTKMLSKYAPDLAKHRYYVWLSNYHWVPISILAAGLCWGICLRVVFGLHITWAVNSATHMWGRRRFNTRDDSRNTWWVALVSFGEGWHNNHHAHPTSARHGLAWYEFDPSWLLIKVLKAFGVAKAIKVASVNSLLVSEREAA
ncbi:MAG: fatty acid desaturase [Candidatus Solibacter sp.]|nr:fatty acid desaturase [Candidatus Solibacter sp.]